MISDLLDFYYINYQLGCMFRMNEKLECDNAALLLYIICKKTK